MFVLNSWILDPKITFSNSSTTYGNRERQHPGPVNKIQKLMGTEQWEAYLTVICLEPLSLCIFDITYIMTRDGCIHNIMMDNHSIQAVHRAIIICFAYELRKIQVLWELDILADLSKNTRLFKEKGFQLNVSTMLLYKFVPNPIQENMYKNKFIDSTWYIRVRK